ncbi:mandelate racemase/muconate lactonizing enzyme family protein [Thermodesulfobacteriota bacterium]
MNIDKVKIYRVDLPFTGDFSISRKKGLDANNVVVEVISTQENIKGYGEGAPVEFVTGETQEGTVRNVVKFVRERSFPRELDDVTQIWDFIDSLPNLKEKSSAICALETALLDALGRYQKKYIIDYLPQEHLTNTIHYGATISLGNKERITQIYKMIKDLGVNKIRIKFDKDFERNEEALKTVRQLFGDDCDLRVDPNGVWDQEQAIKHFPLIKKYGIRVLEEPINPADPGFTGFVEKMKDSGVILMACESAPTLNEVESIIKDGNYQMINVKLNRSGGFRRALKIIELIRNKGLSFQIGCSLGESGILSAGGRALGLICSDAVYYDGSYDRFLLKENITTEDVSFGIGGEAGPLNGPGLGIEVDYGNLMELSEKKSIVTIPAHS